MLSGQVIADNIAMDDMLKKWPETQASALRKWLAEYSSGGGCVPSPCNLLAAELAGKKLDIAFSIGASNLLIILFRQPISGHCRNSRRLV